MHRADKAVLRLAIGLGLAVLIAYGLGMRAAFMACVMAVLLLCKPGRPIPFVKGVVFAIVVGALLVAGVLMVPILENYAVTGVLLTGALLYAVFFAGARRANPLTMILVIAFTVIPVAGVAEQALATALIVAMGVASASGSWSAASRMPSSPMRPARPMCSRRRPPSASKPQAGAPCGPRSSSSPSSCWP